jgi:NDP-sugar pyrophosphorylase family protein
MVKAAFGSNYKGLNIRYSHEPEPLGTGGALRYALPLVESEIVLVMNGDSYIDADFPDFLDWYLKEGHDAAILLTKVEDTSRYGSVKIDEDGKVLRFDEKQEESGQGWINAGVYLLKTSLLNLIPSRMLCSLEQEFFPKLVGKGFYGYSFEGEFLDIGTPESYARAEGFFERSGKVNELV